MCKDTLKKFTQQAIVEKVFPGCAVGIYDAGEQYSFVTGYTSINKQQKIEKKTLFDLASLSKPLATSLACFVLIQDGLIHKNMKLESLLGCSVPKDKKAITLSQLLSHSSGLIDHYKFYEKSTGSSIEVKKKNILKQILEMPLIAKPGEKSIYSDIGYILLFFIIEFYGKIGFENFINKYIFKPMKIKDICYNPKDKGYEHFAATEICKWRQKELSGVVHDQNTSFLDGVCGQAGLFSTIDSVLDMVVQIKEIRQGKIHHPYIDQYILKEATTRRIKPLGGSWGLGFDTPSQPGSSAGRFISEKSCGHLGFTGTSFWIDFKKDRLVVLLTNRVNPTVDNLKIRDFRPAFHDLVFSGK